jgi:hypothetical protein
MDEKTIEKILALAEPKVISIRDQDEDPLSTDIDPRFFTTRPVHLVHPPKVEPLKLSSLSGVVDWISMDAINSIYNYFKAALPEVVVLR